VLAPRGWARLFGLLSNSSCVIFFGGRWHGNTMARYSPITNQWFVSVETPKHLRLRFSSAVPRARETKSFPTEVEAKQFAIAMLSEGRKVTAGTLSPHQPIRRTVTASEIDQWINEEG
jgi:hypothetical protein